jgi:hypothetical protein
MNLYFLSLLQPDRERRKNIACVYIINVALWKYFWKLGNQGKHQEEASLYLITRFPFLQKGDLISGDVCSMAFWSLDQLTDFEPEMIHPFFYFYYDSDWEQQVFSKDIINFISTNKPQKRKKLQGQRIDHILMRGFKMGKTKYELIIVSEEDATTSLEEKIVVDHDFVIRTNWDLGNEINDYMSRYKKRLFLYY